MNVFRWATTALGVSAIVAATWYITSPFQLSDVADVPARPMALQVPADTTGGVCVLVSDEGIHHVRGTVHFRMQGAQVGVTGRIEGLEPGHYRFCVTEYGDLRSNDGSSFGEDYFRMDWPMPADGTSLADLMTFDVGSSGIAILDQLNPALALYGPESIIGRAFVIYKVTASSSDRHVAAGVIGRRNHGWITLPSSPVTSHGVGGVDNC